MAAADRAVRVNEAGRGFGADGAEALGIQHPLIASPVDALRVVIAP